MERGLTYNNPTAHGYTKNHAQFEAQNTLWARKASALGNAKDVISVRVSMGTVKPGTNKIALIHVSIDEGFLKLIDIHTLFAGLY
jgi:hypothetical protein